MEASPKLSSPSKMPCKSWSIPAWDTCPGSKDEAGEAVDACAGCYARTGRYLFGAVKAVRDHNLRDWLNHDWVAAMVKAISRSKYFRWFDSGDVYCVDLANKIYQVMALTPGTKHWLPTRSYKIDAIRIVLEDMRALPNVVVRYSSDSIFGVTLDSMGQSSTILPFASDYAPSKSITLCRAFLRDGKCGDCRACWSPKVSTIAYTAHGNKMKKKLKEMMAV